MTLATLFMTISMRYGLPPRLLASVCFVESQYDVSAIHENDGTSASLGICQIKYTTAKDLGFRGTRRQLMEPNYNIKYAAKYLSHQLKRYHGSVVKAIIAYNKGNAKGLTKTRYSDRVLKIWIR